MRGDFTRDSFDAYRHFTRVQMQQGRVQLDADWNEQAGITEHYSRTLASDLIGRFGGPSGACGFGLVTKPAEVDALTGKYGLPLAPARAEQLKKAVAEGDFVIGLGRYYVDGLLCESDVPLTYTEQVGYPFDSDATVDRLTQAKQVLLYLDVWERHVSSIESPDMLEVALAGPDTATRTQLVWQVKAYGEGTPGCADISVFERTARPLMRARARQPEEQQDACVIDPEARYRGAENQLYRVEIHRGGRARAAGETTGGATFKWSRENGSVAFPVLGTSVDTGTAETTVSLATLGRDRRLGLDHGDWVELVDDALALRGGANPLYSVERIDRDELDVVLSGEGPATPNADAARHPLLRRWDHDASDPSISVEGALLVTEAASPNAGWVPLEDGVMIQFPAAIDAGSPNIYRTGDFWLVPARTATGDVLWPRSQEGEGPIVWEALPPAGVEHHYAPLAVATLGPNGVWSLASDCRLTFDPWAK